MPVTDIYVIDDSISIQYGPYLEKTVEPELRYARKCGDEALQNLDVPRGANGGDSAMVRSFMESLSSMPNFHPHILLANCGLHDIKFDRNSGKHQVSEED